MSHPPLFHRGEKGRLYLLISFLAPLVIYLPSVKGGFVSDDFDLIVNNRIYQDEGPIKRIFTSPFWGVVKDVEHPLDYYRPIVSLSYLADMKLYGLNPQGFHLTNIAVHGINAIFVYLVASFILKSSLYGLFTSLLFSLFLPSVESVAWISGRTDLFCALFTLPAILIFIRPFSSLLKSGALFLLTLLSLLCKETSIVLPILLIFLLYSLPEEKGRVRLHSFIPVISALLSAGLYLVIRKAILPQSAGIFGTIESPFIALLRIVTTAGYYLPVIAFPFIADAHIGIKKVPPLLSLHFLAGLLFLIFFVFVLIISTKDILYSKGRGQGGLKLGLIWLFLFLLPVLNLIPIGVESPAAERFLYIPSAGWALSIASLLFTLQGRLEHLKARIRMAPIALCLTIILAEGAVTSLRIPVWRDHLTFFEKTLAEAHPRNSMVWYLYGHALLMKGRRREAMRNFRLAFEKELIFPGPFLIDMALDLSTLLEEDGERDEAIRFIERALRHYPEERALRERLDLLHGRRSERDSIREDMDW